MQAARAAAGATGQVVGQAVSNENSPTAYFTDMLFRTEHPDASGDATASHAEVGRILATDALSGDMPAADKTRVAQIVRRGPDGSQVKRTRKSEYRTLSTRRRSPRRRRWTSPNARGRRSAQDRCLRGPVGLRLALDRRFFCELYGDRRRPNPR